ncbi:unnamed protein product [Hermetia illucens]|uniref:SET and MYND domain-containing protein 4 n=1 Tax=Hermetia illucens TaxID=343691 RepID=A0A7R8U9R7_HERIL|nr:SET and MYND domain-containing protein 4-like isoform X1 [Hermetia illucens]XP_037903071.1 SET and MYND domain-containing protein 4-like isoform X1 [Hermetia illucens]CAD7076761.1 unnamed protein product [Hermetia illucens]
MEFVLNAVINGLAEFGAFFDQESTDIADYQFENELKTIRKERLLGRDRFNTWFESLPNIYFSEDHSNAIREGGNVLFKKGKSRDAALCYTRAICTAPLKSESLALAHGNRASALYKLGLFEAAYYDCECALDCCHPNPDMIFQRQTTIVEALEKASMHDCVKQLRGLNLTEGLSEDTSHCGETSKLGESEAGRRSGPNEKKQRILEGGERGRYVVSDEPISKGEVILSEEAFASVPLHPEADLLSPKPRFLCDNCAESDIVPFPCYECRRTFYCSPKCREMHMRLHRVECEAYKKALLNKMPLEHLALRCLSIMFDELLKELNKLRGSRKFLKAEDVWHVILQCRGDGIFMEFPANVELLGKQIPPFAKNVYLLTQYLGNRTAFFENTRRVRHEIMKCEDEWETIVAAMLLRLSLQLAHHIHISSNCLAESFTGTSFEAGRLTQCIKYGPQFLAFYPRAALYNHSCDPDIRMKCEGNKLTILAAKDFARGEEISICYDLTLMSAGKSERREKLKLLFGVNCVCRRCKEPEDSKSLRKNRVICKSRTCKSEYLIGEAVCPRCGTPFDEMFYGRVFSTCAATDSSPYSFKVLYDLFVEMNDYLPKKSDLRNQGSWTIMNKFLSAKDENVKDDEQLNRLMIQIAVDFLEGVVDEYAFGNALFAYFSTPLLDLLAIRKQHGWERIGISSTLKKIKRSFEALSGKIKTKFEKYYEMYAV